jgi:methylase of polypeptide subunit release factors
MGLVGVIASSFGHRVTMTEYDPDALNFARANAETNLRLPDPKPEIMEMDWNNPPLLEGLFDWVVGSEVIYKKKDYDPILKLFRTYLKPEGEIILAEGLRQTSVEFFREVSQIFEIKAQKKILHSQGTEKRILLCRMKFKNHGSPKGSKYFHGT